MYPPHIPELFGCRFLDLNGPALSEHRMLLNTEINQLQIFDTMGVNARPRHPPPYLALSAYHEPFPCGGDALRPLEARGVPAFVPLSLLGVGDARVELALYAIQHAHLLLTLKLDRLCRVVNSRDVIIQTDQIFGASC